MEQELDETQYKEWLDYAISLYNDDKNNYEVQEALKEDGAPDHLAVLIQHKALEEYESEEKKGGGNAMLIGGAMIFLGVVLTFASAGDGVVQVFYGLVIVGVVNFFRGLVKNLS